ncbi:MAG: AmpG family muropeptide MFS transporter [Gammaproteobacteria bacterium]|nr:AmpG family muropeptide MFS transporter [Gammaproteobacteria bacterium]
MEKVDSSTPSESSKRNPWYWIPSLYYAEGLPYILVMIVSVVMYKRLGVSNTDIALYTSWLYLPWTIKPLWSPIVDALRTKRFWIISMQLLIGAGLGGVAMTIPADNYFRLTLAFFWLLAFSSATHDIAADGFYMLGISKHEQAWFVGIRSTFYRLAMITGQGFLIILAGFIESSTGPESAEFTLQVKPGIEQQQIIEPADFSIQDKQPQKLNNMQKEGQLWINNYPENPAIPTGLMEQKQVSALVEQAKRWNRDHGFTEEEKTTSLSQTEQKEPISWFSETISEPLEQFIRTNWGVDKGKITTDKSGNAQLVYLHLSHSPPVNEEIIINFNRDSGDKSINIIEGTRFVVTAENWNKPALTVIQIDPKLQNETEAHFIARGGNIRLAWSVTFGVLVLMFIFFFIYHKFMLPYPVKDKGAGATSGILNEFIITFTTFFRKRGIISMLAFFIFYRFAEAQLVKIAAPFLLDVQDVGGLALTTGELGFVYGTVGMLSLVFGGLLGGFLAAKQGLKFWLWWMVIAINLPNAVYIYLSQAMPQDLILINMAVAVEQFGYGFGFTAYMLYMIHASEGEHQTAHFAICTGFMALGMMIPGMFSGWLQDIIGYQNFFIWVIIATIPSFIATKFIHIDEGFGCKS